MELVSEQLPNPDSQSGSAPPPAAPPPYPRFIPLRPAKRREPEARVLAARLYDAHLL